MFLEDMLRARINASALKRGHVDVFVTYANTRADAREVSVDGTLLEAFAQALKGAKDAAGPLSPHDGGGSAHPQRRAHHHAGGGGRRRRGRACGRGF